MPAVAGRRNMDIAGNPQHQVQWCYRMLAQKLPGKGCHFKT